MVQELAGYSLYPAASHFNCNNDNEFDKNYQSKNRILREFPMRHSRQHRKFLFIVLSDMAVEFGKMHG